MKKEINICNQSFSGKIDPRILLYANDGLAHGKNVYTAAWDHISAFELDLSLEMDLMCKLGDPQSTLCQCLWILIKNKWNYPRTFCDATGLHENYYGKIKNNNYNKMGKEILMAICVGLGLNLRITEALFRKSNNKLNYYAEPEKTYIRIIESFPGLSIEDFNKLCTAAGVATLGTKEKI